MSRVWTAILLAGAGTYLMRVSFIAAAGRMATVPPWVTRLLRQIPPAALSSLVLPALIRPEGHLDLVQPRLAAGLIATGVAWRSRNVGLTLLVGLGSLMLIEAF